MSPLGIVLTVILILILFGGLGGGSFISAWPRGYGYGYGGISVIGVILIVVLILALTGRF